MNKKIKIYNANDAFEIGGSYKIGTLVGVKHENLVEMFGAHIWKHALLGGFTAAAPPPFSRKTQKKTMKNLETTRKNQEKPRKKLGKTNKNKKNLEKQKKNQ